MEAIQISQELIGARLTPMVLQYQLYTDTFSTYPYHHSTVPNFDAILRIWADVGALKVIQIQAIKYFSKNYAENGYLSLNLNWCGSCPQN